MGLSTEALRRVTATTEDRHLSFGLLAVRAYLAVALLYGHALPKLGEMLAGEGHFPELVAEMGFPMPALFAWLATLAQAGGAVLLLAGAVTRVGAFLVLSTLAVGIVGVHFGDPFPVVEAGVMYLVLLTFFAVVGAGGLSVDGWLQSRRFSAS